MDATTAEIPDHQIAVSFAQMTEGCKAFVEIITEDWFSGTHELKRR
jgi:hypothetical protein